MTFFYKCIECGKILGFGNAGKGCVKIIKMYGECCYDYIEEAKEIDDWRKKKNLDTHSYKLVEQTQEVLEE